MDAATVTAAAGSATCLSRGLVGRSSSRPVRPPAMVSFADEGHLHYYASARCALKGESKKKEEKRREKLMKGLRKDLLQFSSMRFGADDNEGGTQGTVTAEVKSKMISEAADVLLAQLAQLRAETKEAKETKKRKKQEKKAAMKLAKAKDDDSSSSSSSSESSDSECDSTAVVRMSSSIGRTTVPESHREVRAVPKPLAMEVGEEKKKDVMLETNALAAAKAKATSNKIEVCMGGKCKKSGATELLAEFDRAVGVEGAVVGCKCMGKCRDGPNVRVVNHRSGSEEEEAKKVSRNPLCIGVSLGDVGAVVSNFFGESKDVGSLSAA